MKLKPYWALKDIETIGLTECISSFPLPPLEKILEAKRKVARKACKEILKKNPEAEIIALIGSVAHGDILGWFSDIDLLVITEEPRDEEMLAVDHEILFVEYHSWKSFEELLIKKLQRDEFEERSSYLFFYGGPHFLSSSARTEGRYNRIVKSGVQALWEDYSETGEYLDDFIWFYGSAMEALKQSKPLTAICKLQRGTVLLLRYYLVRNKILLRKPLPDERTVIQLRNSQVPKGLVDFIEQMYQGELDMNILLRRGREVYLQITKERKWLNKIPL